MPSVTAQELTAVLQVAHLASRRGEGLSFWAARERVGYPRLRLHFDAKDLVPILQATPRLVQDWLRYSEDKRTSGGWYLLEPGTIGQMEGGSGELTFPSLEEAVAAFVVRELDYFDSL